MAFAGESQVQVPISLSGNGQGMGPQEDIVKGSMEHKVHESLSTYPSPESGTQPRISEQTEAEVDIQNQPAGNILKLIYDTEC